MKSRSVVLLLIALPIVLSVVFAFALTLSCLVPRSMLAKKARESAIAMLPGGGYPKAFGIGSKAFQLDFKADATMLNLAYTVDSRSPFFAAMADSLTESPRDVRNWLLLGNLIPGDEFTTRAYPRYWHGYLTYLRPLLVLFDRREVLWILTAVLGLLTGLLVRRLWPQHIAVGILLVIGLFLTNILVAIQSLELIQTFVIAVGASCLVAGSRQRSRSFFILMFCVVGALTAYFDMFTTPMLTWGLPLVVLAHIARSEGRIPGVRPGLEMLGASAAAWASGFALTWGVKWLLSSIVQKANVFADAFAQVAFHSGSTPTLPSRLLDARLGHKVPARLSAPLLNIAAWLEMDSPRRMIWNVTLAIVLIAGALALVARFRQPRVNAGFVGLLVVIGACPYLGYAAAAHHSMQHYWFTYRDQLLTVVALGCAWSHAVDWGRVRGAARGIWLGAAAR